MDVAFGVFIQHWMIEENRAKEEVWRVTSRLRRTVACEQILLNRRLIFAFKMIIQQMMDMIEEDDVDNQEFDELFDIAHHLAVDLLTHKEVFGVCDKCESGLVEFAVDDSGSDLAAVCQNCQECHMYIDNIFSH